MNNAGNKGKYWFILFFRSPTAIIYSCVKHIKNTINLPSEYLLFFIISALLCHALATRPATAAVDEPTGRTDIPHYWVTTRHYNWFLDTRLPAEHFQFFLNGSQLEAKAVNAQKYKNFLHIRFHLQPDSNSIIVRDADKVYLNIEVFSAPSYESGTVPEENQAVYFHTEQKEKVCRPCHRLDAKRSDVRPKDVTKQICYPCHSHKFDNLKVLHKPAAKQWRCLICHQYKAVETDLSPDEPLKFMVNQENGVAHICFKCHKKQKRHLSKLKFIHGPIGMGACNLCHNPHGSQLDHLLQADISTLCIECHEFQEELKGPVIHRVIKDKGCTACHDPHGSMHNFQLIAGLNKLCYKCHPDIYKLRNNHPIKDHPVSGPVDPGNKDQKLTCVSCHSPHSSPYAHLLPVDDTMLLCAKCHKSSG